MEHKTISTPIKLVCIPTQPIEGQKLGTSGLRKQVKVFMQPHYVENFIQSYFLTFKRDEFSPKNVLLVGGDGRFFSPEAIFSILKLACANGVSEVHIPRHGLMSTPACSAYIRALNKEVGNCMGGILLTASHNPGGIDNDFGIKFNVKNGGPAPEDFTNAVYAHTQKVQEIHSVEFKFEDFISLAEVGDYTFTAVERPAKKQFVVRIVENITPYVDMMKQAFDFAKIKKLFQRKDFSFCFDGMNGVSCPYADAIFRGEFGCKPEDLQNCVAKPDFGGLHPDPNLTYADQLVKRMCIFQGDKTHAPAFGAACDGDADRNMILGRGFFVTPSDSLAVLTANSDLFLKEKLHGVARSMPTSGAVDKVAAKLGIKLYETPTGWKFFGNLMDAELITLCGEESFGTGSCHIREKDGLWTVLAWLSVLASKNVDKTEQGKLIGVEDILREFWGTFGRNYYSRYDYEACQSVGAKACWDHLLQQVTKFSDPNGDIHADIYKYVDPVDKSLSDNQGIRFMYKDGSRVIFRQSGTGSVGMTIRIYFEKYEPTNVSQSTAEALTEMIKFGLQISNIAEFTKKTKPDVVT